ncbi:MAG: hypothetical protein QJR02_08240 [Sinobacteraceae bacterium]|nr:hypothetical protein [Nevskiaceae bacterium]
MRLDQLVAFCSEAGGWYGPLLSTWHLFGIATNPRRLACFLAQIAHESAGFSRIEEDLNYSAEALATLYPRHFSADEARRYAYRPQEIANRLYANRLGNGDEASGDGWRYRGRGLIQITGRSNYLECERALFPRSRSGCLLASPHMLAEPLYAAQSAGWYWQAHGCNELADCGDFKGITRAINGGLNGLDSRLDWWRRACRALALPDPAALHPSSLSQGEGATASAAVAAKELST